MLGTDWPAIVGAVGGVIGAVGGVAGPVVAHRARRDSRRSAAAASKSADEAAALTRIEHERQHAEFTPRAPAEIEAEVVGNSLFGSIIVPHDYRVIASGFYDTGASHQIGMPLLIRANQPQRFHIENLPPGAEDPKTKEIHFKFWPPIAESDDASPWDCRCGRPTGKDIDGPGHWEWRIPVVRSHPNVRFM